MTLAQQPNATPTTYWGWISVDGFIAAVVTLCFLPARAPTALHPGVVDGIRSFVTRSGWNPADNYFVFFILLGTATTAVLLGAYGRSFSYVFACWLARPCSSLIERLIRTCLVVALLTGFFLSTTELIFSRPLDAFHDGERVGFLATVGAQGLAALQSIFLVHGYGIDVLPSTIAAQFDDGESRLLWVRAVVLVFEWIGTLAACAAIGTLVHLQTRKGLLSSTAFGCLFGIVGFTFAGLPEVRNSLYLLQLALLLTAHVAGIRSTVWSISCAFLFGTLAPLGLLFNYDRGIYGLGLLLAALFARFAFPAAHPRAFARALSLGFFSGLCLLWAIAGNHGMAALYEQIAYWLSFGRLLWALPIFANSDKWQLVAWIAVCTVHAIAIVKCTQLMRVPRRVQHNPLAPALATTTVASLMLLNSALGRADAWHFAEASNGALILGSVFALSRLTDFLPQPHQHSAAQTIPAPWQGLAVLTLLIGTGIVAYSNIRDVYWRLSGQTAVLRLIPADYRESVTVLKPLLGNTDCFYALSSVGLWHLLLDLPSCSRYHQLVFARTPAAEEEVRADLARRSPPLVLFKSNYWTMAIDNVSVANSHPCVTSHVVSWYAPHSLIGNHWFWKQRERPAPFVTPAALPTIDPIKATSRRDAVLRLDRAVVPPIDPSSALVLVEVDSRIPIEALAPWEWRDFTSGARVTVPTQALGRGTHRISLWAVEPGGNAEAFAQLDIGIDDEAADDEAEPPVN